MPRVLVLVGLLAGCSSGSAPDILDLTDQTAIVGQELVLELKGVDADGDRLEYSVKADISLDGVATVSQTPSGNGVFRWTPMASDVGQHSFDFSVDDGSHKTTVSIGMDVRATAAGIPQFLQPLGTGRVVNLATDPCMDVAIMIQDEDSADVTIGEEAPTIDGGMLSVIDGHSANWHWCPTAAQVAASNRYTLVLSADDGDHKTLKEYVIVLGGGSSGPTLVINEIDYDNIGTDDVEYLELLNVSSSTVQLAGLKVALVNGADNSTYQTIDLGASGSVAAGQYLVIAGAAYYQGPPTAIHVDPQWTHDQVQNGAPDGLAIFDSVTMTVIDALSYEGGITAAMLPGFPSSVSLVEGTMLDAAIADSNDVIRTICRNPNGQDTNNASADFIACNNRSVGAVNKP
jgi:hypothetical protein